MGGEPAVAAPLGVARFEALGTGVLVHVADRGALAEARSCVERELRKIDRACSRFRGDSELARVNGAGGRTVEVGVLFCEALAVALRGAELTDGDVDPTLGRALELCGYDRDWRELAPDSPPPPAGEAVRAPAAATPAVFVRARAGWGGVELDVRRGRVRLPAGVRLDLGATAKAWAADRCAAAAALATGCGVLVGVGGDLATAGSAPTGGWRVWVTDDHRDDGSAPGQTVSILTGGVATSSTAVRRWRHHGASMHHVIDPATGAPVRGTWRTVSVAGATATDANIAATAAIVRGPRAPDWLVALGLPARLVDERGAVSTIAGWPPEHGRPEAP
jgi:thiamine biosynthesis lipoprotein